MSNQKHENPADQAVKLFKEGLYCSEAILQAYNEHLHLGLDEAALKMATGFGAGLGGSKCLCGSLGGAVMVLGALKGRVESGASEAEVFRLTLEIHNRFKERFKSTCCRALTRNVEWNTPEHHEFCTRFVKGTAEILEALLNN